MLMCISTTDSDDTTCFRYMEGCVFPVSGHPDWVWSTRKNISFKGMNLSPPAGLLARSQTDTALDDVDQVVLCSLIIVSECVGCEISPGKF